MVRSNGTKPPKGQELLLVSLYTFTRTYMGHVYTGAYQRGAAVKLVGCGAFTRMGSWEEP